MDAPAIVQSPDGSQAAAAWMDYRRGEESPGVCLARATAGKFAAEGEISQEKSGEQGHPTLAWDAKTQAVYAVWEVLTGAGKSIRGCVAGKSRAEWAISDDDDGICTFPVVSCGAGLAVAAYESSSAGGTRIRVLPAVR